MEYRNLGSAGVKVSSLCLGAMTFGEADEHSFMHRNQARPVIAGLSSGVALRGGSRPCLVARVG